MKIKILIVLLLSIFQTGYSQTEKPIFGRVWSEDFPLKNIEIINQRNEKIAKTDENGKFQIDAKVNDVLVFFGTGYTQQKIIIDQDYYNRNNIRIELLKNVVELEEVEVSKEADVVNKNQMQAIVDKRYVPDLQTSPKNPHMYDGTITDGIDFVRIGKSLAKLFKKKDTGTNEKLVPFKDYVSANFSQSFYTDSLKLKPEEIELFLEFCKSDPNSAKVVAENNVLVATDFMLLKNEDFKKNRQSKK